METKKIKVRVSLFALVKPGHESWDYPEEIYEIEEWEFYAAMENDNCTYDELMNIWYSPNNTYGYEIIG